MKRLAAFFSLFLVSLFGATKLNLIDVKPLPNPPPGAYLISVSAGGGWTAVMMDPAGSVTLDTTVSPFVLRSNSGGGSFNEQTDDYTAIAGQTSFVSSSVPRTGLHVYRNGLIQRTGPDYTISGSTITFVGNAQVQVGDFVTLIYQR